AAFTYTSALDVDQELRFNRPIEVTAGTSAKLTVSLDLSGWFRNSVTLVDPATAAEGGANEDLVRHNIIRSFQAFKDNNEDGRDDDHEGEDGGHQDRKSTRLNSSHLVISYAVFCLKKKTTRHNERCAARSSCPPARGLRPPPLRPLVQRLQRAAPLVSGLARRVTLTVFPDQSCLAQ